MTTKFMIQETWRGGAGVGDLEEAEREISMGTWLYLFHTTDTEERDVSAQRGISPGAC